jgi:hypothetical protein
MSLGQQNRDAEDAIARANEVIRRRALARGGGRGSTVRRQLDFPVTTVQPDQLVQMDVGADTPIETAPNGM